MMIEEMTVLFHQSWPKARSSRNAENCKNFSYQPYRRLEVRFLGPKNSFSSTWSRPRTALHLAAGKIVLINVAFLVPDDDLTSEDLFIRKPVLHHLQVETRTLPENNRATLDVSDF